MSAGKLAIRIVWFYLGLFIFATGGALIIKAGLGAAPWDIFHLGTSRQTGVQLAYIVQATGGVIILLDLSLGIRPTLGMILNMLSVGPILQAILSVRVPLFQEPVRWLMLTAGILMVGLGTALYVSADLGAGPRDGLMIGLTRRLGLPVAVIKNGIDLTVALAGWWLGGPLGFGTVVIALLIGPSIQMNMGMISRLSTYAPFNQFVKPVSLKRT
jgi:uncharacterized membrane protein YczE